ncbi:ribonuclease domain-containing protein [Pseudomonas syringae group sp. 247E2]|uniref:ribonuclease domain-containing protein n=1 Tax=Pseudomonas syringae group sp. 247E2 TaxID=3079592 RepID=UPI003977A13B
MDRTESGGSFPHRNDGSVFQSRALDLPQKPAGYYTEYVHPTPGIAGPRPQRIVVGKGGEMYYTADHYKTFIPVKIEVFRNVAIHICGNPTFIRHGQSFLCAD